MKRYYVITNYLSFDIVLHANIGMIGVVCISLSMSYTLPKNVYNTKAC